MPAQSDETIPGPALPQRRPGDLDITAYFSGATLTYLISPSRH
jgi:hypothetical protein